MENEKKEAISFESMAKLSSSLSNSYIEMQKFGDHPEIRLAKKDILNAIKRLNTSVISQLITEYESDEQS